MLKFYVYELKLNAMQEDWSDKTSPGVLKPTATTVSQVVVNYPSHNLCIGGHGKDGKYYQYDSYEAYHSYGYFKKDFDTHGLWVESYPVEIPLKDLEKYKVK